MPVTLSDCDDEPIHIPGAIQPHGALVACDLVSFRIVQISANSLEFFDRPPTDALGQPVEALFHASDETALLELVANASAEEPTHRHLISRSDVAVECIVHRVENQAVIEIEHTRGGALAAFDARARQVLMRLSKANSAVTLAQRAVQELKELTGFDRVMLYRFDADWHGNVVAEAKSSRLESFLGLHYPASDIPVQARRLYTLNRMRVIAEVSYAPVPLVRATRDGAPLDLSRAHLRSVSPIHIEYLTNMGVTASTSISLVADGRLLGLIACHHYSGPRLLSHTEREVLEYLGQSIAWNLDVLERAAVAERVQFVQQCETEVIHALGNSDDPLSTLATDALCALTEAMGAAVVLTEGTRTIGKTPDAHAIAEIVRWLRSRNDDVFVTDRLIDHLPLASTWPDVAAGVLATTISRELGEYLIWFRASSERTVDWAGEPRKSLHSSNDGTPARLSPRGSFALWREIIRGRSAPWEPWQIAAASDIRRLLIGGARRRIATLKSLNQRLADADRAKDLFIAMISHELRNPLAVIAGWSRMYLEGGLPSERRDDVIKIVARNANVLANLVDDLLDTSRMLAGTTALSVETVDLAALIESVTTSMAVAMDAKGLRVKTNSSDAVQAILGDPVRLRQIVSNLLSNAIKFTDNGGTITIALTGHDTYVELSVRDTGIGLDPDSLKHIFETFWQADSSAARKEKGLGLGLSIVKRLVELHGGSITAESAGPGHGTMFCVRLPVAATKFAESRPPPPLALTQANGASSLKGVRALVVEDEDDSRALVRHILERAGALVAEAPTAVAALEELAAKRFDVIVSDVGMPGMDGLELIANIRNHVSNDVLAIPAVALTAYSRSTDRTRGLRAGFQAYVSKPTDPEELVTVICSVLGRL